MSPGWMPREPSRRNWCCCRTRTRLLMTKAGRHEPGHANDLVFWTLLLTTMATVYALPVIIAIIRYSETIVTVLILNVFPLAWPAALVMACMLGHRDDT
jgi:hypothetical protein